VIEELAARNRSQAEAYAETLRATIADLRAVGITTGSDIARALNGGGVQTPTGKGRWHQPTVHKLLRRLDA
jgi:hypothetical protein